MNTLITEDILLSSFCCPLKGYLKFVGVKGTPSDYELFIDAAQREYILNAQRSLQQRYTNGLHLQGATIAKAELQHGVDLILDARIENPLFSLRLHGLLKVPGTSPLGPFYYVPILFHEGQCIHATQKQLLALWSLALGEVQRKLPERGTIVYGSTQKLVRVSLTAHLQTMSGFLHELEQLPTRTTPPKLVLNEHCQICEFRQRCAEQAMQADELSLLRGMGEKEITKYQRKGIFTITQLSYTFRPRKKAKRVQQQRRVHSF
jgi:predicted RecB family nuclease